jgi:Zn-dependent peptidase ImmA (M78 family)
MVLVNSNDSPFRKRFTIAHELGHFLLHLDHADGEEVDRASDLFRTYETDERSTDRSKEVEANQFAAALLMPAPSVMREWETLRSLELMAIRFNVSEEAMGYRLATLGL